MLLVYLVSFRHYVRIIKNFSHILIYVILYLHIFILKNCTEIDQFCKYLRFTHNVLSMFAHIHNFFSFLGSITEAKQNEGMWTLL